MTKAIFSPVAVTTIEATNEATIVSIQAEINETKFPKLLRGINSFLGGAYLNGKEDDYTYQVSNVSYQDIHDYIRNVLTRQRILANCIELEYDETGEQWFKMVYARQVGTSEYDYTEITIENLDEMFSEEMMERTINQARSIHERLSFPM